MLEQTDDNIFSFYAFPGEEIRLGLYTSYAIERFNSKLKSEARKRVLMNSENNAAIVIAAICRSYNRSRLGKRMNGLAKVPIEIRKKLEFDF